MKLRINDMVMVMAGKDKGVTGMVTKLSLPKNTVIVDGVNKKVRNVKQKGTESVGNRVDFFAPIAVSNVAVIDPKTKKPTRVGYRMEDGKKVRFSKASGETLPSSASLMNSK